MKKNIIKSLLIIFLISGIVSCKPTEKGYKAAYDAALHKREAAQAVYSDPASGNKVQLSDGPQLKTLDGREYFYLAEPINPFENEGIEIRNFNVAIASFKMPTNCRSLISDLRDEGYPAFGLRNGEDNFFVVANSFHNLSEAVEFSESIRKTGKFNFIGLPGSAVVIYSQ